MLQWMGGSRRKVTSSRKSTQKRQKQYFEQRKRQQQQQNSNGLESYYDKKTPSTQCHENSRSLDILSLLNLSKNGQDFTSKISEGRGNSNGQHTTPNSQTAHCPTTNQMENENLCTSEHVEIKETRTVSSHLEERECPQKVLFDFSSSSHPDASKGNNEKDPMKMTTDHKLSVVDMLGDDGQNSSSRGNIVLENHVAFSVEGLGKVEMETPVHSPQYATRKFTYGRPAPSKIFKGSHSSKNINRSLEDQFLELDDMPVGGDIDIPSDACYLKLPPYSAQLHHNSKKNIMVDKECLLHDAETFLSNDEFSENRVEHDRFNWHEKSSFLDDNCGASWKNWSSDLDYMRSRKCDKLDLSFEGGHMLKRRARVDTSGCFNVSGLSSPYKHQINHRYDFMTSDMTRCNSEFSETTHCTSDWPSFTTEDARDNLHLSREDSFLSHPVWREGTMNPPFNFTERQKVRQHTDSRSPFSMKNSTFSHEFGMKSNMMSDFSSREDDWLFEERCNTKKYASMKASETQTPKASHFDHKHSTEKPFDSDFNIDEHGGNFFSDKVAFCQQVSHGQPSLVLSRVKEEYGQDGLFNEEKDDSTNVQLQKSVSTRESDSVALPAVSSMLHQHRENSHESNHSSSKIGTSTNALESEESHVKTPELTPAPNAVLSPERSEGGSSSVEMPHKLQDCHGLIECPDVTRTSLLNQNEHKETGDLGPNSCKVMMLGKFVLQLL